MEEEELYADFKKHLNVDFGEEYEEENLRTNSIPRKSIEGNEYIEDNLTEQLGGLETDRYYENHEDQPMGRNYSDVSDGAVGYYQDEQRKDSADNGNVFTYGHPDDTQDLQNLAEEALYNNNYNYADVQEEKSSDADSNIDLRDFAGE